MIYETTHDKRHLVVKIVTKNSQNFSLKRMKTQPVCVTVVQSLFLSFRIDMVGFMSQLCRY